MHRVSRRNVLTTTSAAAVAAAVPAIASAKPASDPLATDRARDQAVLDIAERMPADARAWIDTARAAGSHVHIATDSNGERWLGHHFADTDPEVTSFLQRWQAARLDAGDLIAELAGERLGENDRRLWALANEAERCAVEAPELEPTDRDAQRERALYRLHNALGEVRETTADSWSGLSAKAAAVRSYRRIGTEVGEAAGEDWFTSFHAPNVAEIAGEIVEQLASEAA